MTLSKCSLGEHKKLLSKTYIFTNTKLLNGSVRSQINHFCILHKYVKQMEILCYLIKFNIRLKWANGNCVYYTQHIYSEGKHWICF